MGLDGSAQGYDSLGNTLHPVSPPSIVVLVTFYSTPILHQTQEGIASEHHFAGG